MNPIEEMRNRLVEKFSVARKPIQGLRITADDSPRLPQSTIPSPKVRHDRPGRPVRPQRPGERPTPARRPTTPLAKPPRREIPRRRF